MKQFSNKNKTNKKSAFGADSSEFSNAMWYSGLSSYFQYSKAKNFVKGYTKNNLKTLEVGGIAPPNSWMTIQSPHCVTPRAVLLYHKIYRKEKT